MSLRNVIAALESNLDHLSLSFSLLVTDQCIDWPGSSVYMIASTVSSKMLQAMAREEGFQFEVSDY